VANAKLNSVYITLVLTILIILNPRKNNTTNKSYAIELNVKKIDNKNTGATFDTKTTMVRSKTHALILYKGHEKLQNYFDKRYILNP
jgi:hypothetical protein